MEEILESFKSWILESNTPNKFYHASIHDNLKYMKPRLPNQKNAMVISGDENNMIERISFAPSILFCLMALGYNLVKDGPKIFYIYEPIDYKKVRTISNEEIIKNKYVPDAHKTKELWVINKIEVKKSYKIKVLKALDKYEEYYWHASWNQGKLTKAKLYYWDYKILEEY